MISTLCAALMARGQDPGRRLATASVDLVLYPLDDAAMSAPLHVVQLDHSRSAGLKGDTKEEAPA